MKTTSTQRTFGCSILCMCCEHDWRHESGVLERWNGVTANEGSAYFSLLDKQKFESVPAYSCQVWCKHWCIMLSLTYTLFYFGIYFISSVRLVPASYLKHLKRNMSEFQQTAHHLHLREIIQVKYPCVPVPFFPAEEEILSRLFVLADETHLELCIHLYVAVWNCVRLPLVCSAGVTVLYPWGFENWLFLKY